MTNRSKECIEFRNDHESKCYLVNSDKTDWISENTIITRI